MKKLLTFLSAFALIAIVYSCADSTNTNNNNNGNTTSMTTKDIPSDTGKKSQFTFFSLKDGKVIDRADSNTTKWDIGFQGTTIITNSGKRGPGVGGAFVLKNVAFDAITSIPADSTFYTDADLTKPAIPTGSGNGWYNYNSTTLVITPIAGRSIIVRTAEGKYAKMQIVNYYKGAPAVPDSTHISRWYTIKYNYQADGSKNF
jgi:hypothetical protein